MATCVQVRHVFHATDFEFKGLCCQVGVEVCGELDSGDEFTITSRELESFAFATNKSGDCFPDWLDELIARTHGDELIDAVLEKVGDMEVEHTLRNKVW